MIVFVVSEASKRTLVFSSEEKLLAYFQQCFPDKESLRLKEYCPGFWQVINHTTPVDPWRILIERAEMDSISEGASL